MKIKIAKRFLPFSHLPGTQVLIPGTLWVVQAFPARLLFYRLGSEEKQEFPVEIEGPVIDFTVQLDLEKDRVVIFGHGKDRYHRIILSSTEEGVEINYGKKKELLPLEGPFFKKSCEKLSFGQHKELDWELVCRRKDLKEILPLWFYLGNRYPASTKEVKKIDFLKVFLGCFQGILVPDFSQWANLGLQGEKIDNLLDLLAHGAKDIRAAFFKEDVRDSWHFLSATLPDVDAGRFVGIETKEGDRIDLEWSKKKMRRMVIHPAKSREVNIHLQKGLLSYRLRTHLKERGDRISGDNLLQLQANKTVYLDRFEV